jgi:hypothetical protein
MRSSSALPFLPMIAVVLMLGCGTGGNNPQSPAVAVGPVPSGSTPPAADLPLVSDLNYANWKKYPVGTTVRRKKVSTSTKEPGKTLIETSTLTLAEATDAKVVVETQITVEKSGYATVTNPPMKLQYLAAFRVPPGLTAEAMQAPDLKAKVTGEETVQVLGKEYKAKVYEWMGSTESGPMPIKLWLSDDMPGRQVKSEFKMEKGTSTAVEEVIEVKLP